MTKEEFQEDSELEDLKKKKGGKKEGLRSFCSEGVKRMGSVLWRCVYHSVNGQSYEQYNMFPSGYDLACCNLLGSKALVWIQVTQKRCVSPPPLPPV